MIWLYRTRVGPFEIDEAQKDSRQPEEQLCTRLNEWRTDLIDAAGLKSTSLMRRHPPSVYKHCQYSGDVPVKKAIDETRKPPTNVDDFHSPTHPESYISLRIQPAIAFYARRIPMNTRRILTLKLIVLLLGVSTSLLARYEMLSWATVVTAAATGVISWQEFSGASAKVERYSTSIVALKMLLSWWDSQGEVQRATKGSITNLVKTSEAIISQEQLSWTASASKPEDAKEGGDVKGESGGGGSRAKVAPAPDSSAE